MPSFFRKKFKATIVAATIASLALGGLVAAPAQAAPVQQSASVQRAFGDGTWTPATTKAPALFRSARVQWR